MQNDGKIEFPTGEEVLRKFFNLSLDLFAVVDKNGRVVRYNKTWENLLGYSPEEIAGRVFTDFIHPEDKDRSMIAFESILEKGELIDFTNRYPAKDGRLIYIEWRAFLEGDLIYCVARDVTKRVEKEIELKESKETYQFITESMTDVIWLMDPFTQKFIYLSPSVERLRGYTVGEVMQQSLEEVVTAESATTIAKSLTNGMQHYFATGEFFEKTIRVEQPLKGGGTVWTEVVSTLLKDADGNLRVLGVTRNITENLKMENELKQKNSELQLANSTRDKLLSVISHDLRSPFHPILNMSDILRTDLEILSPKEIKSFAEDIHNSAVKVMNLLENLLKWTRVQAGALPFNPVSVDLKVLVKDTLNSLKYNLYTKNITVDAVLPAGMVIEGDVSMLQSLVQNLITNAMKFSYPGSMIRVSLAPEDDKVILVVTDQGVGMTGEQKARLFLEHEIASTPGTSNEKGSGLGLRLCFEFVARHKGTIEVETEPGKGTKFIVKLPK